MLQPRLAWPAPGPALVFINERCNLVGEFSKFLTRSTPSPRSHTHRWELWSSKRVSIIPLQGPSPALDTVCAVFTKFPVAGQKHVIAYSTACSIPVSPGRNTTFFSEIGIYSGYKFVFLACSASAETTISGNTDSLTDIMGFSTSLRLIKELVSLLSKCDSE